MDIDNIIRIVKSTKKIILNNKNHNIPVQEKGTSNYVTRIDYDVQKYLKVKLYEALPEASFIAEEQKQHDHNKPLKWILDPIDGTTNLIHDYRQSAVSLALVKDSCIELGIIYNPYTDETFKGVKGEGSYLNDVKIHSSINHDLKNSLIAIGTCAYDKTNSRQYFEMFLEIFNKTQDIRRTGSAAIDIANVAVGRVDGFVEKRLNPWDYAAGIIVLLEAGGKISNWNKQDLSLLHEDDVIATNSFIYNDLISTVSNYKN